MVLAGIRPWRSVIEFDEHTISVRMPYAFSMRAPRSSLISAEEVTGRVLSRGVHGWRGRWLVNGAGDRLVLLRFDPPTRGRVLGFPVRVRELTVSVEDPTRVVALLQPSEGN